MSALTDIKILIEFVEGLKKDKESYELNLKKITEQIEYYTTDIIPTYLQSLGLQEVVLDTGLKVSIATKYFGNISEERAEQAHKWLEDHEFGSLIKTEYNMKFGKGELEQVEKLMVENFIKENDISHVEKKSVHPATLKAFIKSELEEGHPIPLGLFGVHIVKEIQVGTKQTK